MEAVAHNVPGTKLLVMDRKLKIHSMHICTYVHTNLTRIIIIR